MGSVTLSAAKRPSTVCSMDALEELELAEPTFAGILRSLRSLRRHLKRLERRRRLEAILGRLSFCLLYLFFYLLPSFALPFPVAVFALGVEANERQCGGFNWIKRVPVMNFVPHFLERYCSLAGTAKWQHVLRIAFLECLVTKMT